MGVKFNPFTGNLDLIDTTAAAGADTQVQYNNGGSLAGSADLTWDDSAKELGVGGDINLDDGGTYETTVQVVTPTANRTISFPDATGTVALVAGSSGQLTYNDAGAQAGLTSASIGSTGEINISLAGAASTPPVSFTGSWFTGGTATTTKPQLLIEPTGTTSTAWSTDGTGLGVNAASGFSGRLLDLQTNGTSRMVVQGDGALGINTTSPSRTFEVSGSGTTTRLTSSTSTSTLEFSTTGGFAYIGAKDGPNVYVETNGSERLRVDSSGRLLVGTSSARSRWYNTSEGVATPLVQLDGTSFSSSSISIARNDSSIASEAPRFLLGRSRGATAGSFTVVQSGDDLGSLSFQGADGAEFVEAALIKAEVDDTPGANDMPGRLVFSTTADGASSPTERMRIKSSGIVNIANTPTYADNTAALAGGLVAGDIYRKSDGTLMITY